jgi:hypothetical protein
MSTFVLFGRDGAEGEKMVFLKSLWSLAIALLFCLVTPCYAKDVTLLWNVNTESNLLGYKVYYGFSSQSYDYSVDVGNQTSYTLSSLVDDQMYYFAVTAYNTEDLESDFSNEVATSFEIDNQPPIAEAGPDQIVDEGVIVTLNGLNSIDQDGGIVSYYWEQIDGLTVVLQDPVAAETFFPAPNVGTDGEALTFQLTVTDNSGLQTSDTCIINVSWVNEPPIADVDSDQTVNQGDAVTLDGSSAADPDDGIASYFWEQMLGPPVALSDSTEVQPTFIAPYVGQEGYSLTFRLTVTDNGGLKATDTCIVNVVSWINLPPFAEAGPDQTVTEGDWVTLDGSSSADPDDGIASYHWTQTAGIPVTLDNPTAVHTAFTAPRAGTYEEALSFKLTVSDKGALQSTDNCKVIVIYVNAYPDLTGSWESLERLWRGPRCWISGVFNVQNLGNQRAETCSLLLYQSIDAAFDGTDSLIAEKNIDILYGGESMWISFKAKLPNTEPNSFIIALIDAGNTVSESEETNNIIISWPLN